MKSGIQIHGISTCIILLLFDKTLGENGGSLCQRGEKKMDRAWVTIRTMHSANLEDTGGKLVLYGRLEACYKCKLTYIVDIPTSENCTVQLPTMFGNTLEIREVSAYNSKVIWNETIGLRQHSDYVLLINKSTEGYQCKFYVVRAGEDPNIPIYVALSILMLAAIISAVITYTGIAIRPVEAVRIYLNPDEQPSGLIQDITEQNEGESPVLSQEATRQKNRVRSLDAFRGICLVIMIFVNYGGGGYWFFDHSYWNGLTVADLVFPWFTWIIGTAIALSFKKLFEKGTTRLQLTLKVLKRTAILFFIGLALESSQGCDPVSMSHIRIPGVLQRLAVSYCVVALLQVLFAKSYVDDPYRHKWFAGIRDIVPYWLEWLVMLSLVALHLLLTFAVTVPGCPKGYIGPGGLANHGKYPNCTGGAAGYIDRLIFGENHIYNTPTCKEIYKTTIPYDPEGTLGTLTSIFMCFLGLQAGKILIIFEDWKRRIIRWLFWGVVLGVIAGCLCRFTQNEGWIPVNKNLWSVTFVLSLASMAFILLTVCYVTIDVFRVWSGAPLYFTGMNSILVYVSHIILHNYFPVSWDVPETHALLLALHLWGPILWTIVAAIMYYKKIFVAI